jgi:hypothetical protein
MTRSLNEWLLKETIYGGERERELPNEWPSKEKNERENGVVEDG